MSRKSARLSLLLLTVVVVFLVLFSPAALASEQVQANIDWGKMPLYFIANKGQTDSAVSFYVRGAEQTLYFTPRGLTFSLADRSASTSSAAALSSSDSASQAGSARERASASHGRYSVKLDFVGVAAVKPVGETATKAVVSYFTGKPDNWRTGVPTYSSVLYADLWPGIDVRYRGTMDHFKQEFILDPGVDPGQIRLRYRGADVTLDAAGNLVLNTQAGSFTDEAPVAYQDVNGERVPVAVAYDLQAGGSEDGAVYGFTVGDYDRSLPLVIDPTVLFYVGFFGGGTNDEGYGIAVDAEGNTYVTGYTSSDETTFPVGAGPDSTYNGGTSDAFVAKVNAAGTALLYCSYLGGSGYDLGEDIALDSAGNVYITGYTSSSETTFPALVGPDLTFNGGYDDAFVAKVSESGTSLLYCGYIGGSGAEQGYGIRVDAASHAYITGSTTSDEASFPVVVGPDLTKNGYILTDAFVAKVNPAGTALLYCGYIGGSGYTEGHDIAVDPAGNAYITGRTQCYESTFPETVGPDLTFNGGAWDAYVAKVNSAGTALVYCGYIGGSGYTDEAYGIAVDSAGSAYVTGFTESDQTSFPVAVGPDLTFNGGLYMDAFVAKVKPAGTGLDYCGYIGGSGEEKGLDIAVDATGNAYVTGFTDSPSGFPVTAFPDGPTYHGRMDVFVAKVNAAGSVLPYCGYLGDIENQQGLGIAVDTRGDAYVTGFTYGAGFDVFVAKIASVPSPTRYEQGDSHIVKTGTWANFTAAGASGGSYGRSATSGASATITFSGTRLDWVAMMGTTTGIADVYLDDAWEATIDLAAPTATYKITVYSTGYLPAGVHKVQIVRSDTSAVGKYLTLDAVDVVGTLDTSPPAVTSLSPSTGAVTGGTSVTINGTGFAGLSGASAVMFGDTPASSYLVDSSTKITAVAPPHALGTVDVRVTGTNGTSANTAADDFTYADIIPSNRYEQTDTHIRKVGIWTNYAAAKAWGGTYGRSSTAGAYATICFNGTRLDWYAMKGTTTGIADVYLDGVKMTTINLAATTAAYNVPVWSTGVLADKEHVVRIVRSASSAAGKYLTLDAVEIWGTIADAPIRYEQADSHLVKVGTWSTVSNAAASGGSYSRSNTASPPSANPASVTIYFTGTRLDWIAMRGLTTGSAVVYVDGVEVATVTLAASSASYNVKVWSTGDLLMANHSVRIVRAGSGGSLYLTLDALDIWGTIRTGP